jgi:hypothetical protein
MSGGVTEIDEDEAHHLERIKLETQSFT